jgi:hypothetical protein
MILDRREFTNAALMAMLSGVTVTIVGCSKGPASPSPGQPSGDRTGSVTANHGHTAVITSAQLNSGSDVTLNIRGSADHPHTVVVTLAELGVISSGQRVTKVSSTDPSVSAGTHSHQVIFN